MTVKRRTDPDSGEETFHASTDTFTKNWRVAVAILLITGHPLGQQLMPGLANPANKELTEIKNDLKELATEVKAVKQAQTDAKTEIKSLNVRFDGFQIDLDKLKKNGSDE